MNSHKLYEPLICLFVKFNKYFNNLSHFNLKIFQFSATQTLLHKTHYHQNLFIYIFFKSLNFNDLSLHLNMFEYLLFSKTCG